jgi:ParB-like nuclease domain
MPPDRVSLRRPKVAGINKATRPIAMEWVHPGELKPDPTNARKHSRQQIRKLARDIQKNSFINPILITRDGDIVAGHARLEAARLAGLSEVPVIRLALTKAEAKIRNIWDNKSSDLSHFDDQMLGLALQEIAGFDIDIEDTGFSIGETDLLIKGLSGFQSDPQDDDIPAPSGPPISMVGDVWKTGAHRIMCADASTQHPTLCSWMAWPRMRSLLMCLTILPDAIFRERARFATNRSRWQPAKCRLSVTGHWGIAKQYLRWLPESSYIGIG